MAVLYFVCGAAPQLPRRSVVPLPLLLLLSITYYRSFRRTLLPLLLLPPPKILLGVYPLQIVRLRLSHSPPSIPIILIRVHHSSTPTNPSSLIPRETFGSATIPRDQWWFNSVPIIAYAHGPPHLHVNLFRDIGGLPIPWYLNPLQLSILPLCMSSLLIIRRSPLRASAHCHLPSGGVIFFIHLRRCLTPRPPLSSLFN
jgi:hypothetical protein